MNYNPQKKPPRMGNLVDPQDENIEQDASLQAGSFLIDLSEPTPTEEATTTQPPVDMPEPPATRSKKLGGKEKKSNKNATDPVDKDKYSIYLPKEMSQSLRMAYVVTGRKFSHLAEEALEDMLYHKYQCHEKSCTCRFSMEAGAKVPTRCPACGGNKISLVKYR